jgi:hypothetical protein
LTGELFSDSESEPELEELELELEELSELSEPEELESELPELKLSPEPPPLPFSSFLSFLGEGHTVGIGKMGGSDVKVVVIVGKKTIINHMTETIVDHMTVIIANVVVVILMKRNTNYVKEKGVNTKSVVIAGKGIVVFIIFLDTSLYFFLSNWCMLYLFLLPNFLNFFLFDWRIIF